MEEEDKIRLNTRIEEKDNEILQISLHQEELVNQLNNLNQEVIHLRKKNEKLINDLRI